MTLATLAQSQHAEVKRLWTPACKHDGIDPSSKFVNFSENNPHVAPYNDMIARFQQTMYLTNVTSIPV